MNESPAGLWSAVILLAPFWWGIGLLLLAFLSKVVPPIGRLLDALFRRLEACSPAAAGAS